MYAPPTSTFYCVCFSHLKVIYMFGFQYKSLLERVNEYATLRACWFKNSQFISSSKCNISLLYIDLHIDISLCCKQTIVTFIHIPLLDQYTVNLVTDSRLCLS